MTNQKVMKLALEALEDLGMKHFESTGEALHKEVFDVLKEALAKQEQRSVSEQLGEPVARCQVLPLRGNESVARHLIEWKNGPVAGDLYTTPQQRTWVGLTGEDRLDAKIKGCSLDDYIEIVEAKLKEKNT